MNTINKINSSRKITSILLSIIILLGICRFSYGFFVQKNTFHSDEAWSFGLANSYYEPYIQYNDDTTEYKNINSWINGDIFTKYLTVQKGERFSFGSVYYNQTCDLHPPLYFFILNILCSFFPDQYIFALGFLINMIAFVFMSVYIYRLLLLMTKSRFIGLTGTLFSTFTLAMLCMTMFVRMYMLVATFAIIFTFYVARLYYMEEKQKKLSSYIVVGITALLGALTDNFFLPYAFGICAVMFLYWLVKKDFKVLLKFSSSMISAIALSFVIYPQTIYKALGINTSTSGAEHVTTPNPRIKSIYYQFKLSLSHINKELFGIKLISPDTNWWIIYTITILAFVIIFALLIVFLFRHEKWFICLKNKLGIKAHDIKLSFINDFSFITIALLCSIIITCLSVSYATNLYEAKSYGDRYLMVCFPAALIVFVLFWRRLFSMIFINREKIATLLTVIALALCCISSNIRECPYFFKYPNTMHLEDIAKDSNFIVVSTNKWLLVQYAAKLFGCNDVFFTTYYELDDYKDIIENHKLTGDTYILIDSTIFDHYDDDSSTASVGNVLSNATDSITVVEKNYTFKSTYFDCTQLSFVNNLEYVGDDYMNGFHLKVYKVN